MNPSLDSPISELGPTMNLHPCRRHRGGRKGTLFRTMRGRSGELTGNARLQSDVWRMIRRRALAAGIKT
jgi:hypothetical protein